MKIAAIDLDGTLLHSDCTVSEYTKNVISRACREGIMVVPTSGRCYRSIQEQVKGIEGIRYCISSNGTAMTEVETETFVYNHKIPQELAYEIYSYIRQEKGFVEIYSDNDTYVENDVRHIFYDVSGNKTFCDNLFATTIPILSANLLLKRGLMKVNKFSGCFDTVEKTQRFVDKFEKTEGVIITRPFPYSFEIFYEGSNKDEGLRILCERYGIDRSDVIAIGDSNNDISMIEFAGTGAAVSNAMDVLKEKADIVIGSNDEDGPAHFLEEILSKQENDGKKIEKK